MRMAAGCSCFAYAVTMWTGCGSGDASDNVALECALLLEPAHTIGVDAGEHGPTSASSLRLVNGLYYLAPTYSKGQASVFDAGGRFVHTIGNRGSGPAELQEISGLAAAGDTVFLHDRMSRLIKKFVTSGEYVATAARINGHTPFAALPNSNLVLVTDARDPGPATIRIVGSADESTFEISNESTDAGLGNDAVIAIADTNSFWIGFRDRLLIERYSLNGDRLARIHEEHSWFPPPSEFVNNRAKQDTISVMADIAVDGSQRLYSLLLTRAFDPGPAPRDLQDDAVVGLRWRATINVYDMRGRQLASYSEEDSALRGFADGEHVYFGDALEDGTPIIRVLRTYVVRPRSREVCQ